MCGIAGMIDWRAATSADALRSIGEAMIETVRHRGPDAGAVWVEAEGGVALGQRRLAIIDLSPGGAQPMHSADRRHVITFNGEIYNYRDIRRELEAAGRALRSDSDTEVLLEACALWGVEAAIERAIGMFAFALWDRKTKSLLLARDRLGIKPLYYAATPQHVLFASQLKAFRAFPQWQPTIDDDAVAGYLRHAYIAQPHTIYREARKLAPGHILTLREGLAPAPKCFWDLRGIADRRPAPQRSGAGRGGGGRAARRAAARFRQAADDRRRAARRVPVRRDRFLDRGRLDAGAEHAAGQDLLDRLPRERLRRGASAKRVAGHLGTDHTEFYVEPRHALDVIPQLPDWFDEPFADPSQIPTYLVSELTRKHVTVALSGDGGDELFAGYNRYFWAAAARPRGAARAAPAARRLGRGHARAFARRLEPAVRLRPRRVRGRRWPGDKLHKIATLLDHPDAGCDLSAPGEPMGASRRDRRRRPRAARAAVGRDGGAAISPISSRACSSSTW